MCVSERFPLCLRRFPNRCPTYPITMSKKLKKNNKKTKKTLMWQFGVPSPQTPLTRWTQREVYDSSGGFWSLSCKFRETFPKICGGFFLVKNCMKFEQILWIFYVGKVSEDFGKISERFLFWTCVGLLVVHRKKLWSKERISHKKFWKFWRHC